VGGQYVPTLTYLNSTYSAPISAAGIGGWRNATNYPLQVDFQSCVFNAGYIFCVGGQAPAGNQGGSQNVNSVYYALPASLVTTTATSTVVSTTLVTSNKTLTSTVVSTSTQTTTLLHNITETSTATETLTSSVTQQASTVILTQTESPPPPVILVRAKSSNGTALRGIKVILTGSGGVSASLSTNSSGYALFTGLTQGGTYTVAATVEKALLTATVPARGSVLVILEPTLISPPQSSGGIATAQGAALIAVPVAAVLVVVLLVLNRTRRRVVGK
jgi:hypothetical protein